MSDVLEEKEPVVVDKQTMKTFKPKRGETLVYDPAVEKANAAILDAERFDLAPDEVLIIDGYGARKELRRNIQREYDEVK